MKALLFLSVISSFLVLGVLTSNSSVSGSPNDQNSTTNPTTTATTTTTTLPPTTTTTEPPRPGDYNVSQCLRLKALIRIDTSSGHKYVPSNAATSGTCNQTKSTLIISWNNEDSVTFIFSNDNSTVYLKDVTVKLSNNSQEQGFNMKLSSAETFYECSETAMKIGNYNVTLNSFKVQAFHYNSTFSGNGENCDAPKPTTTTTAPVTTVTQGPVSTTTVKPSLATNNYTISGSVNGTNVTCLLMNAAIEFNIPYEGKTANKTYKGFIGKSPSFQGSCEKTTDSLKITTTGITLEFTFKNNDQKYSLSELKLVADTKNFPDGKDTKIISDYTNNKTFQLQVGDYYSCKSKTTLDLSSNVKVFITNLQLEAFRNSSTSMIDGKMVLCPGDQKTNSIVPIAVGAALAGLVVVVLIAYLIGRKRSRRGYESV